MSKKNEQSHILSLQHEKRNDTPEAVRQVYDEWAMGYDADVRDLGYAAPQNATAILADLLTNRDSYILDGGCGTGLVGSHLHQYGFNRIDGCDYSTEMLTEAEKTRYYGWLGIIDMTKQFPLDSNCYDASLCIGVLGPRLPSVPMIPELIRILKPGGVMLVVIREQWYASKLQTAIEDLEQAGKVERVREEVRPYFAKDSVNGYYIALQKSRF